MKVRSQFRRWHDASSVGLAAAVISTLALVGVVVHPKLTHADTTPIQHVVVIMEENHTFDNYFGDFPSVANTPYGLTEPQSPNPMPHDVLHNTPRALAAIDGGKMDNFDPLGASQYKQSDIPTYWNYASQYGLGANFYTDAATSSTPNHIAMIAAQTGGNSDTKASSGCGSSLNTVELDRDAAGDESYGSPCYAINSIPQELTTAGLSYKMYGKTNIWSPSLFVKPISNTPRYADSQIVTDAQNNNLPAVSFVTPDNDAYSDHMPEPTQPAQNFVANTVNAIMQSSEWNSTAIFVTWDDFGGWYDHMPPAQQDGVGLGPRVPLLAISPWAKQGYTSFNQGEFASFPKFIEENFGLPSLGARDSLATTSDLMDFFDFSTESNSGMDLQPMLPYNDKLESPYDAPNLVGGAHPSTVSPAAGGPGTNYTYEVVYTGTTTPTESNVTIDGTTHPMTAGQTNSSGTIYTYTTTLKPKSHTYSFQFSDGTDTWNLPYNNVSYTGPIVAPFNLSNISVSSPGSSNGICQAGQPLTINVKYTDSGAKVPTIANVLIDGVSYPMTAGTGSATTGLNYTYTTSSLPVGDHYMQFEFSTGDKFGLQDFQENTFSITPIVLQHSGVSAASGTTATPFTFSTTYFGPNMPSQVDVVVDKKTYPMTYVSGDQNSGALYQATMTLPTGKHTFAFYATDGTNAWSAPKAGTYKGLKVTTVGQPVQPSVIVAPPSEVDDPYPYDAS